MLEHKGLGYRQRELPGGLQPFIVRALGFPGRTVPALRFGGRPIQTNRRIARFLDEVVPERPLLPAERRAEIERAETFADEILQPLARRLVLAAGKRNANSLRECGDDGPLGALLSRRRGPRRRIIGVAARYFAVDDYTEGLDLAALPSVLDQVDGWVEDGVLNGPEPNAADFQTAPSLCLLSYRLDLAERVRARPSWQLVERLIPAARESGTTAAAG